MDNHMRLYYFAYGSNLNQEQMADRCPTARFHKFGVLDGYSLCFRGYSHKRNGAVASVQQDEKSYVEGVLYNISLDDLKLLDKFEGYPMSYMRSSMDIITDSGGLVKALVYFKEDSEPLGIPSAEYLEIITKYYYRYGFSLENLRKSLTL